MLTCIILTEAAALRTRFVHIIEILITLLLCFPILTMFASVDAFTYIQLISDMWVVSKTVMDKRNWHKTGCPIDRRRILLTTIYCILE